MSIKLRAKVRRSPLGAFWLVTVTARDAETGKTFPAIVTTRESHPEAIQASYKLLADLDVELMAEVHASRSSRRTAAPVPATAHASLVTTTEPTA